MIMIFGAALRPAVVGAKVQAGASGSCLLVTRVHSELTENRSASLVQQGGSSRARARARAVSYYFDDPISQPKVAGGLMFVIIVVMAALSFSMKPFAEGTKKRIPKQGEASQCSQSARPTTVTVHALNGLRVLFIANTIFCHYFTLGANPFESVDPSTQAGCLSGYPMQDYFKYMPMSFFTILSGFLRTTTNKESEGYSWKASLVYAARVIARFGPAYWIALASLALVENFKPPLLAWPVSAAFMQPLLPVDSIVLGANTVAWFVSCIVLCSFIFPGCYNISLKMQTHQKTWLAIMCILVLLAVRCVIVSYLGAAYNFYARAPEFFMGMFTAQITSLMDADFVRWGGWGWLFDILMIAYLVVPHWFQGDLEVGIVPSVAPLAWCAVIVSAWAAAQCTDKQGKAAVGVLGKLASLPLLTSLAEYSFGAYIYQRVAMRFADNVLRPHLPDFYVMSSNCGMKWLAFITSWVIAVLSEKLVEKHIRF